MSRSKKRPVSSTTDNVVEIARGWNPPQHFKALTPNHRRIIQSINKFPVTIIHGPAGSLKTFLAVQTGLQLIKGRQYEKFLYIRQNIQRPNEKSLGALPGEEGEKLSPLLKPIEDNLNAIVPPGELSYLLRTKRIEASCIESIRGRSPLSTILHLDEAQNSDTNALKCVMTRVSESSKLIITGDFEGQRDLYSEGFDAFEKVCKVFSNKPNFSVIGLGHQDILRNPLIVSILEGFAEIETKPNPKRTRAGIGER